MGSGQGLTDDEWRQARACYYGGITEVDQHFGRLLAKLEEAGELERTVVIVTAVRPDTEHPCAYPRIGL